MKLPIINKLQILPVHVCMRSSHQYFGLS